MKKKRGRKPRDLLADIKNAIISSRVFNSLQEEKALPKEKRARARRIHEIAEELEASESLVEKHYAAILRARGIPARKRSLAAGKSIYK